MQSPQPKTKNYNHLFGDVDNGRIKIPRFQRDFVWKKQESAKLIDSILRGFPIGTFILWETKDRMAHANIGNHKLPDSPHGDFVQYVLDGQQRIASLYAVKKGISLTQEGVNIDYKDIYIDLSKNIDGDEEIVFSGKKENKNSNHIPVYDVLNINISELLKKFNKNEIKKIEDYRDTFIGYLFSIITITDSPIEVACEVFRRINTGGMTLTVFQIMVAKTYDEENNFDLAKKYKDLVGGHLAKANFETISESVIMQCVAIMIGKSIKSKDILKISRGSFIDNWKPMTESLFYAIDFIKKEFDIAVSRLLPYDSLLVLFTYFFKTLGNKQPSNEQIKLLEQFLYWVGLTERYSSASETKIAEDLSKIKAILEGKAPQYPSHEIEIASKEIKERIFRVGNAYSKTILCLLSSQKPRNFTNSSLVALDNNHLSTRNSKNYHHFFPKGYLEEINKGAEPNLIANITIVNAQENLQIGKKPPSQYIKKFQQKNDKLSESLETHLISDLKAIGIENDDYETFIKERSKIIANKLNKKLSPK